MAKPSSINYWVIQFKSTDIKLKQALKADAIQSIPIKTYRKEINKGDKIIIIQDKRPQALFALGTIESAPKKKELSDHEKVFYKNNSKAANRVAVSIDINLWEKPLSLNKLKADPVLRKYAKALPGTNYKASEEQFLAFSQLAAPSHKDAKLSVSSRSAMPLNMILSGPPGSGKTFHTVNYSLAILEGKSLEELAKEDRAALRLRFEEYMEEGLVNMLSFHKNYSYGDFIESQRLVSTPDGKTVEVVEDGIFKHICLEAKRNMVETLVEQLPNVEIKVDFNALYKAFLEYIKGDQFKFFITKNGIKIYLHKIKRASSLSVRPEKSFSVITLNKAKIKQLYRSIEHPEAIENIDAEIGAIAGSQNQQLYWAVLNQLKQFEFTYLNSISSEQQGQMVNDDEINAFQLEQMTSDVLHTIKKYVLIIDEINRGDIAAIFGELISLIEEDRREGGEEMTTLVLPYSKTLFLVPPNVYIIGTMDSTSGYDQIDPAMLRRFKLVELEPRPDIITKEAISPVIEGIDLAKMLVKINTRIKVLLGKNKQIGHTHFLKISTLEELKQVYTQEILPLLTNYFKGDLESILMVLGDPFFEKISGADNNLFPKSKFIKNIDLNKQFLTFKKEIN